MNYIQNFISEELIHALGWTVLHSLWQAAAVGLVLTLVLRGLQKQTAEVRYRVAYAALLLTLGLAVLTFFSYWNENTCQSRSDCTVLTKDIQPSYHYVYEENGELYEVRPERTVEAIEQIAFYLNTNLPAIVFLWLLGVVLFTVRLLAGLAYVQHLKTAYTAPIAEKWQYLLEELAAQIPVQQSVQLLESALIQVPMVIGHLKPVILLPVGAVNALTPAQVEAILAHELAHIARHDYLLHLLQSVIEIFFYFNPAVWWISAMIRTEREHCCDDTAVALCGNELTYAKALVALQERSVATPNLAMTFANNKNVLLKRIQRILNHPQNKSEIMEKLIATCFLLAIFAGLSLSAAQSVPDFMESPDVFVAPELEPDVEPVFEFELDTIPNNKRTGTFSYDNGEMQVEATFRNGEITRLNIDGEEIPADEIKNHVDMVNDLIASAPEPPLPPTPPSPDVAPTPPIPPTPEVWNYRSNSKVTREKDKDGNATILIENANGEDATIKFTKDGKVFIDGKELKEGEEYETLENRYFDLMMQANRTELMAPIFDSVNEAIQSAAKAQADWERQQEAWRKNEEKWREQQRNWERQQEQFARQQSQIDRKNEALFRSNEARSPRAITGDLLDWSGKGNYIYKAVGNDRIFKTIEKELQQDGLVKGSNYKFELSSTTLKINDKEQPAAVAQKYRALYEKEADFKLKSDSRVVYNRRTEE